MKRLPALSLWLLLLIVSMPLVHAQSLEITKISGRDTIEGIVTAPDVLKITAKARIADDEDISPDQLRLRL